MSSRDGVTPAEIFSRRATANSASGYPSGVPIPPANNAEWNAFARTRVGDIDEPDSAAERRFNLLNEWVNGGDIDIPLLDLILDMPLGYRISGEPQAVLRGVPLGYLVERLAKRARERQLNGSVIQSLVLVGKFYRISTEIRNGAIVENLFYGDRTSEFYTAKEATRVMQEYSFMQYPLARVTWVGNSVEGAEPVEHYLEGDTFLDEYVTRWGASEGGSDVQTFMFGEGAYIAKRYGTFHQGENAMPATIRNSHIMRTAGLRQVILRNYDIAIPFEDTFCEKLLRQYRLFVPGGGDNCFLQSLRWFLLKHEEALFFQNLDSLTGGVGAQDEDVLVGSVFDSPAAGAKVDKKIQFVLSSILPKGCNSVKQYLRRYSEGLPVSEMNKIGGLFFESERVLITLWKRDGRGRWTNLLSFKRDEAVEVKTYVTLFLITDTGKMLDMKEESDSATDTFLKEGVTDGSLGHMLHCVSTFPAPSFFVSSRGGTLNVGKARTAFCKKVITNITAPLLADLYEKNRYNPNVTQAELVQYVESQNARYKRNEVTTLIFNDAKESFKPSDKSYDGPPSDKTSSRGRKRKRWQEIQEESNGAPRIYIYAYDLETVDNEGKNQELVYPAFRRDCPSSNYEPIESQIPFSAQWVGVNVSDEGKFLERKLREGVTPLDYKTSSTSSEYFITPVTTDYGANLLLGECIESFLVDIAVDVHSRGGKVGVLYATNGSKFDAYVVLQFQRFEILHMLKTSRGIMTVKLRVPLEKPAIGEDYDYRNFKEGSVYKTPGVSIILRDISLLVPGSLSRLCKGFEVPKEFCKLDFPIQMVNASNCYNPKVMDVCEDYGEKDVCALAVIIKKINLLIGNSVWDPASHLSDKPPIFQFLTCMSMIRASTKIHFDKTLPSFLHPRAIDIPILRNWVSMAAIGGRVTSYGRTYVSDFLSDILVAALGKNKARLQEIHSQMLSTGKSMQCLDFTSLYPYVMDSCPLPMGSLKPLTIEECRDHIDCMGCATCDFLKTLCPVHRYYFGKNDKVLRPFSIIIVKNVRPGEKMRGSLLNLCPRKTFNSNTGKPLGLNYSGETNEEFFKRTEGKEKMLETQAFSNVDLYWMCRQGFEFEIVGGLTWATTMIYNTFIGPAFQLRIDAKKNGNKLLSDFMKLNYNGAYGITIQQDITDSFFLANLEKEFQGVNPLDPHMRDEILKQQNGHVNGVNDLLASEELTGESFYFPSGQSYIQKRKKEHLAEFYAYQSPMQVGAAILAYARHVGNLVLFNLESSKDYLYTDTDSIAISDHAIMNDLSLQALIMNRDDAPMGSLKNDHADNNGTEPRIVFGMLGAKKVKGYITLNKEGDLKIFNTFKGLNVSLDLDGKKIDPMYAEYKTTTSLLRINESFTSEPVEVQAWKRDLSTGVSIGNHVQNFEKETYTNYFQAILPQVERPYGKIEFIIPHGAIHSSSLPEETLWRDLETPPPRIYEDFKFLLGYFIEEYYEGCEKEYHAGTEEYQKILDLFASLV